MDQARQAFLSRETGQPVVAADGVRVGRLVDLTVRLDAAHPEVSRVAVGRGRRIRALVPWSAVTAYDAAEVGLGLDSGQVRALEVDGEPPLEDAELLLCRDVLDTEVVDLVGRRVSRVSDVLMIHRPDGALEVAAVDVGLGSLLRRLGLGLLALRLGPVAVDWADLHLTSRRGHVVQLGTSTPGFRRLDAHGLAELLARLGTAPATDVMRTLGPARSAAALRASHPVHRRRLLRSLGPAGTQQLIDATSGPVEQDLAAARGGPGPVPRRRWLRSAGWRRHRPPGPGRREAP